MPNNNIYTQSNNTFSSFKTYSFYNNSVEGSKSNHRIRAYNRDISNTDKTKALIGSSVGTILPIFLMMKKQNIKNPLKLKYEMKDMITTAAGSIIGGVGLGLIGEKKEVQKKQIKRRFVSIYECFYPNVDSWWCP